MTKLVINWQGSSKVVYAQKIAGTLWFHLDGETHSFEAEEEEASGGQKASLDPSKVVAPMPGKIIKIVKAKGDLVKDNDTIVVMEAMKMEYNLKASQTMRIKEVKCKEGDQVSLGSTLVTLEEDNG